MSSRETVTVTCRSQALFLATSTPKFSFVAASAGSIPRDIVEIFFFIASGHGASSSFHQLWAFARYQSR